MKADLSCTLVIEWIDGRVFTRHFPLLGPARRESKTWLALCLPTIKDMYITRSGNKVWAINKEEVCSHS